MQLLHRGGDGVFSLLEYKSHGETENVVVSLTVEFFAALLRDYCALVVDELVVVGDVEKDVVDAYVEAEFPVVGFAGHYLAQVFVGEV